MKHVENAKLLLLFLILVVLVVGLFFLKSINQKSTNFYEYEKSKINLTNVKYIQERVDYIATLSQDEERELHRKYSTHLNEEEIEKIEKILDLSKTSDFYDIQINAYMLFDNEKVAQFQSKRFTKLPSHYKVTPYMVNKLQGYGLDDYQHQNLTKLQEQLFTNRAEFVNTVIDRTKLRRSDWLVTNITLLGVGQKESQFLKNIDGNATDVLLEESDIKEIVNALKNAHSTYAGIK